MAFTFNPGQHVGGFLVEDNIAKGEFSETWRCRNPISGRIGVLKGLKAELLNDDSPVMQQLDLVQRTRDEVKILTALWDRKFSFVPNVYDVFEVADGRIFFLSEFIRGRPLDSMITDDTVSMESRAKIAFLLLHALETVHSFDIVHRDVSPDNIFARDDFTVVLLDFGLAKIKSDVLVRKYSAKTLTPISKIKYTPPYCLLKLRPGETVESNESWDLYAAGVVLFELFSKRTVDGPIVDIPEGETSKLPCPETLASLLAHAQPNAQATATMAKETLFRELREHELVQDIESEAPAEAVSRLREENERLMEGIKSERKPISFETIVQYMSRLGLIYEVNPKSQYVKLEAPSSVGNVTFVADAGGLGSNIMLFVMPGLRKVKKTNLQTFKFLNRHNASIRYGRYYYSADSRDIRYEYGLLLNDGYMGYNDFRSLFSVTISSGIEFAKAFDGEFEPKKEAESDSAENKAMQATSETAPSAAPKVPDD